MVNQQLPMIHFWEDLDVSVREELKQMLCLRLGYKRFLCAVPVVDMTPLDGFKLVGINILISVTYCFTLSVWLHFLAFVQKHIEIMRMEDKFPEACPMVASPYI